MSIDKLKTKFITGAFINDVKHYFSKINEIIDYLNGNGLSGTGSYKVYTASLLGNAQDIEATVIFNNTLGNIIWSKTGIGTYKGTLNNSFKDEKTWCDITIRIAYQGSEYFGELYRNNNDEVLLNIYDQNFTPQDQFLSDIEIRVYN